MCAQIYTEYEAVRASNWDLRHGENKFKIPITKEALSIVKKNFTVELEFYEFCKQRLDEQYKKLILSLWYRNVTIFFVAIVLLTYQIDLDCLPFYLELDRILNFNKYPMYTFVTFIKNNKLNRTVKNCIFTRWRYIYIFINLHIINRTQCLGHMKLLHSVIIDASFRNYGTIFYASVTESLTRLGDVNVLLFALNWLK